MKKLFLLAGIFVSLAGCKPESSTAVDSDAVIETNYPVRGVVQSVAPDLRHVTIKHEKIPGYMAAMTMDFSVKDTNALAGITAGDEITFTLAVRKDDDWIENLQRTGTKSVPKIPGWHFVEPALEAGDTLPDYEFTAETGRPVRFSDFRGRAVAFTFFFTSCPLPEYCPRMNKNFHEARSLLLTNAAAPQNWQMLSISFDSSFDTAEILSAYARFYRGDDPNRWLFAVASANTLASLAPKVDLNFWREGGTISHNMRTVVLDTNGKIFKQFDGNDWTPPQLAAAIRDAAKSPAR